MNIFEKNCFQVGALHPHSAFFKNIHFSPPSAGLAWCSLTYIFSEIWVRWDGVWVGGSGGRVRWEGQVRRGRGGAVGRDMEAYAMG